jgi:hypothetical protein
LEATTRVNLLKLDALQGLKRGVSILYNHCGDFTKKLCNPIFSTSHLIYYGLHPTFGPFIFV